MDDGLSTIVFSVTFGNKVEFRLWAASVAGIQIPNI